MARRTGGISIANDNDLSAAIARVMHDQAGYYLIGYKPSQSPAKAPKGSSALRKIAINVTRPGLKVRFHSSLYAEPERQPSPEDAHRRLAAAVSSPFAIADIHVRLASRFWDAGPTAGSILDTVFEIDARDLVFSSENDGRRKAAFDLLAVIYGTASKPLDTFEKSYTVSLTATACERALHEGLVQRLQIPLKQPGAYQIYGAVRDRQVDRIGSAGEFIEVPDLTRGRLALSGVVLSDSAGAADVLKFRPGQTVFYAYQLLNAQPSQDGSIHVEVRAALYRNGKALGNSDPIVVDGKGQPDRKRLLVTNDFRLGKQLPPGDYSLQVTAVDKNAPKKWATATQYMDFGVAN
jgi:hypothetical protein